MAQPGGQDTAARPLSPSLDGRLQNSIQPRPAKLWGSKCRVWHQPLCVSSAGLRVAHAHVRDLVHREEDLQKTA